MLDAILDYARTESEVTGDGNFILSEPKNRERLLRLPACANDNNYGFLIRNLCVDGLIPSGPHCPPDPPMSRVTESLSSAFVDDNIRAYL